MRLVSSPLPRTPNPSPVKFWGIERMLMPLKNDVNVSGVKSIYMIIIVIIYNELADFFK